MCISKLIDTRSSTSTVDFKNRICISENMASCNVKVALLTSVCKSPATEHASRREKANCVAHVSRFQFESVICNCN